MVITIQDEEYFRRLLFRPFLTLSNCSVSLSSLQRSYPPLSHSVKFSGTPWNAPLLHCVRHYGCPPKALPSPVVSPSFQPHRGSFHPLTICSSSFIHTGLLWLFPPDLSFKPLLILLFLQWEDKQRWDILLLYCMLLITLICRQLQIILKLLVLPALYVSFIYSLFSFLSHLILLKSVNTYAFMLRTFFEKLWSWLDVLFKVSMLQPKRQMTPTWE